MKLLKEILRNPRTLIFILCILFITMLFCLLIHLAPQQGIYYTYGTLSICIILGIGICVFIEQISDIIYYLLFKRKRNNEIEYKTNSIDNTTEITIEVDKVKIAYNAVDFFMKNHLTAKECENLKQHIADYARDKNIDKSIIITNDQFLLSDISNFSWVIGKIFNWQRKESATFIGTIFIKYNEHINTMSNKLIVESANGKIQKAQAEAFVAGCSRT